MDCFDDSTIATLLDPQRPAPSTFDAHLDACPACRDLVGAAVRLLGRPPDEPPPARRATPGDRIGRYILLSRLGEGASGVVFAGHDPDLDRRVAVKVLASSVDPRHDVRLLEEARTLAQVTHPNVVRVYDAGTAAGSVFLAMELLTGGTLRSWCTAPRPWPLVLARYQEAGRGLSAAHAIGLVHRDFKPDNVLLAGDGRVCVADFGLARAAEPDSSSDDREAPADTRRSVGTPRYMAPEAHRGGELDASADQFSFCAALFEALYRRPAFDGDTSAALSEAKMRGAVAEPRRVGPRALLAAITRGLRPDPGERFGSMDELLAALDRIAAGRRRRIAATGLVASITATAGLTAWIATPVEPDCPDPTPRAWNAERDAAVLQAAHGSEPAAAAMIERAVTQLGRYADRWGEAQVATCRARASGAITEPQAEARRTCLDLRLAALDGLGRELEILDAAALERVSAAAWSLPDIEHCLDPDAPAAAPSGTDILRALQHRRGAVLLGRFEASAVEVQRLRDEARRRGDPWTAAEAGSDLCWIRSLQGEPTAHRAACEGAMHDAVRGSNDAAAARAWIRLVELETDAGRPEVAEVYEGLAAALLESQGDPRLAADLEGARASRIRGTSPAEALVHEERALALEIEAHGEYHPEVATRIVNVAVLRAQTTGERALDELARARAIIVETEGDSSLALARAWEVESTQLEDPDAAVAAIERAVEITERVAGRDGVRTHLARANLAMLRSEKLPGQTERALAELEQALAGLQRAGAGDDPRVRIYHLARAMMLRHLGRDDEARSTCRDATRRMEAFHGPRTYMMAMTRGACADLYAGAEHLEEARDEYRAALSVLAETVGEDHPKHEATERALADVLARLEAQERPNAAP